MGKTSLKGIGKFCLVFKTLHLQTDSRRWIPFSFWVLLLIGDIGWAVGWAVYSGKNFDFLNPSDGNMQSCCPSWWCFASSVRKWSTSANDTNFTREQRFLLMMHVLSWLMNRLSWFQFTTSSSVKIRSIDSFAMSWHAPHRLRHRESRLERCEIVFKPGY